MLNCRQASRLVSEGQDRTLSWRERWGLRMHLWMCSNCRRFERQIRLMRRAFSMLSRRAEDDSASGALSPDARERIRKHMDEKGGPDAGG